MPSNGFALKQNQNNLKKDIPYRNILKMPLELNILCLLAVFYSFLVLKSKFMFIEFEEVFFFLLHIFDSQYLLFNPKIVYWYFALFLVRMLNEVLRVKC